MDKVRNRNPIRSFIKNAGFPEFIETFICKVPKHGIPPFDVSCGIALQRGKGILALKHDPFWHTVICFQAFTFIEVNHQYPMPAEQLDCGSDKVFYPFCVQHPGIQADGQRNIDCMAAGSFVQFHPAASSVPKSPKVSCSSSAGFGAGLGSVFLDFSFFPALGVFPL